MEWLILFEGLKVLWIRFEIRNYFKRRKKEKAQVAELASINQRLKHLENVKKSKKLDS